MQVAKWGNSLAIRLPKAVVDALKLKQGDDVEIVISGARHLKVARNKARERALEKMRAMKWELPEGFSFDRDEANAR